MSVFFPRVQRGLLVLSWALYDLANQFFALNVVSLYFVRWVTLEKNAPEIFYSISFGISVFFVAILSPILGGVSDETGKHRPFLVSLTLLSIFFTMLLGVSSNIFLSLLFFAIANFGCQLAIVFYNALMINIASKEKAGLISGLGRMFGYSGAIVSLYLIKPVVLKSGYQATFLPTALYFLIFSLPCMLFIKDKNTEKRDINLTAFLKKEKIAEIFTALRHITFGTSNLSNFLKASFFSLCSVNAVILFMSIYATRVFGLNESQIINLVAFSTLFAVIGSFFSGVISDYFGQRNSLCVVFFCWIVCFVSGAFIINPRFYIFIGAIVGIALGSTWTVSRALAMKLSSKEKVGEVFGLFNLVGYLSAVIGALVWGLIILIFNHLGEYSYRIALLSLTVFITVGMVFLLRIPNKTLN